jgi:hypothetical protein
MIPCSLHCNSSRYKQQVPLKCLWPPTRVHDVVTLGGSLKIEALGCWRTLGIIYQTIYSYNAEYHILTEGLYLVCAWFHSHSGYQLSWLRFLVVFICLSRQIPWPTSSKTLCTLLILFKNFLINAVETTMLNSKEPMGHVWRNRSPEFYSEDFTVNANFCALRGTCINRWKQHLFV